MSRLGTITRRTLLVAAAAAAGGAAFGYYSYRKPYPNPLAGGPEGEATFNPWLKIAADGTITVIVPRAEMGQGVTTTLAALVAEELDVTLDAIKVEHGPASHAYYNEVMLQEGPFPFWEDGLVARSMEATMGVAAKFLGIQGTGGSTSTRDAFDRMRRAGAAARDMRRVGIVLGVHGERRDAELGGGARDADRDFAAIGDQQSLQGHGGRNVAGEQGRRRRGMRHGGCVVRLLHGVAHAARARLYGAGTAPAPGST